VTVRIIGLAFVLSSTLVTGQTPPTPQDCVKQGRDFTMKRQKDLSPMTAEIILQINAERVKLLRECAAAIDVEKLTPGDLAGAIELYSDAQQPEIVERIVKRGLAAEADVPTRAAVLTQVIRSLLRQPKSEARNATAERHSDMLDALPDTVIEQKIAAHSSLNGYYRGDDIDAGIIKHSTWLIDASKQVSPELRQKFANNFVSAYVNLAEALAGQGDNDKALDLLRRAQTELADLPRAADRVKPVLARYSLVGKPAAAVTAPVWLNRTAAPPAIDLKGKVTLLQFTAHWCGPCKESYPGMTRLQERFKDRGFQVVFYTRTYGSFEGERNLTPEAEIERDKTYYARYKFTHPIAIGTPSSTIVDGKPVFQKDPVEDAYGVSGIPQINLIDAQGNLRLIMIGYDDANEEKLARIIEGLLKKT
jgi:thiol-disulfide isomerase/thioredoxin